jgi:hypothetical protein
MSELCRVVAKVEKLVAMSASPHLEEARTSAFMACRLIREHSLQVVVQGSAHDPKQEPEKPFNESEKPFNESEKFRPIRVRHKGYCQRCRVSIFPGEMAFWSAGNGLLHMHCKTQAAV